MTRIDERLRPGRVGRRAGATAALSASATSGVESFQRFSRVLRRLERPFVADHPRAGKAHERGAPATFAACDLHAARAPRSAGFAGNGAALAALSDSAVRSRVKCASMALTSRSRLRIPRTRSSSSVVTARGRDGHQVASSARPSARGRSIRWVICSLIVIGRVLRQTPPVAPGGVHGGLTRPDLIVGIVASTFAEWSRRRVRPLPLEMCTPGPSWAAPRAAGIRSRARAPAGLDRLPGLVEPVVERAGFVDLRDAGLDANAGGGDLGVVDFADRLVGAMLPQERHRQRELRADGSTMSPPRSVDGVVAMPSMLRRRLVDDLTSSSA